MHIMKMNASQIGQVMKHIDRPAERNYSNENIDKNKSHKNYTLIDRGGTEYINNRIEQVKHLNRSDVVKLVGVVVTLPQDYRGNEKEFFKATTQSFAERYGKENIVYAKVHKDEKTPHLHLGVIPIVKDKDGREKLCCKELFDKNELKRLHPEIEKAINKRLPEPVRLLNGETKRDHEGRAYKNVNELKRERGREEREHEKNLPHKLLGGVDYRSAYEQEHSRAEQLDRENRQLKYDLDKTEKHRKHAERELREYAQEYKNLYEQVSTPDRCIQRAKELEHKQQQERERNERINEYERNKRENHQR